MEPPQLLTRCIPVIMGCRCLFRASLLPCLRDCYHGTVCLDLEMIGLAGRTGSTHRHAQKWPCNCCDKRASRAYNQPIPHLIKTHRKGVSRGLVDLSDRHHAF